MEGRGGRGAGQRGGDVGRACHIGLVGEVSK